MFADSADQVLKTLALNRLKFVSLSTVSKFRSVSFAPYRTVIKLCGVVERNWLQKLPSMSVLSTHSSSSSNGDSGCDRVSGDVVLKGFRRCQQFLGGAWSSATISDFHMEHIR